MINSVGPIDGTLTGTTTPGQSGPESNKNKGVCHITKGSSTGDKPSLLWEMQLVYSTGSTNWVDLQLIHLNSISPCVGVFYH